MITELLLAAIIIASIPPESGPEVAPELTQPDPPPCAYVHTLEEPMLPMPCPMAEAAGTVWLGCEAGRAAKLAYGRPEDAVGAAGELGQAQIHPTHAPGMAAAGLDYYLEADRIQWAIRMWERSGWGPWSCGQ